MVAIYEIKYSRMVQIKSVEYSLLLYFGSALLLLSEEVFGR